MYFSALLFPLIITLKCDFVFYCAVKEKICFYSRVLTEGMPAFLSQIVLFGELQYLVYSMFKKVDKLQISVYGVVFLCLVFVSLL